MDDIPECPRFYRSIVTKLIRGLSVQGVGQLCQSYHTTVLTLCVRRQERLQSSISSYLRKSSLLLSDEDKWVLKCLYRVRRERWR